MKDSSAQTLRYGRFVMCGSGFGGKLTSFVFVEVYVNLLSPVDSSIQAKAICSNCSACPNHTFCGWAKWKGKTSYVVMAICQWMQPELKKNVLKATWYKTSDK